MRFSFERWMCKMPMSFFIVTELFVQNRYLIFILSRKLLLCLSFIPKNDSLDILKSQFGMIPTDNRHPRSNLNGKEEVEIHPVQKKTMTLKSNEIRIISGNFHFP